MKIDSPKYVLPAPDYAWAGSARHGAGIFFLDGRTHVAPHRSPAERDLLDRGALHLASLRFDPDPREGRRPGTEVRTLAAGEAVARFSPAHAGN